MLQRDGDAVLQVEPGAGAVVDGLDAPSFQPAVLQPWRRAVSALGLGVARPRRSRSACFLAALGEPGGEAAGVRGEEQQPEVGVELVGEDLVEVELDVGLP